MVVSSLNLQFLPRQFEMHPLRFGRYDAHYGVLLKGDGKGGFSYLNQQQSGFRLTGDVRSVLSINNELLFGINQQEIRAYK
jgi:hypothetical protein